MVVLIFGAVSAALAILALVGVAVSSPLAAHPVRGERLSLWKAACFLSTLWPWALALAALEWLVVAAQSAWWETGTGTVLGSIILGALLAAFLFEEARRGWGPYWKALHDSLDQAIPLGSKQRTIFNEDHLVLLRGGKAGKTALRRIIGAA